MSWTKLEFIQQAYEELGLASYVFDLSPEQLQSALNRLDAMMAAWNARGIRLGYPVASAPLDASLSTDAGVPDSATEAVVTNLAVRIAPSLGKVVSPETKYIAKSSYDTLLSRAAMPAEMQLPATMPAGSGNKPWRNVDNPFLNEPEEGLLAGEDGEIEFN